MPLSWREGARHPGIAGDNPPCGRAGKHDRLLSGNIGLNLILSVVPGHAGFPAESVDQHEVARCPPTILSIQSIVLAAGVQDFRARLSQDVRRAEKKIGKIYSRLVAGKVVLAVFCGQISFINLVVVKLATKLNAVSSD